jgi:DNA repair protein SbcD/Mre11
VKLLHTADWHAGRNLHGLERTAEIREVLQEIAEIAKTEAVDLILVAGDIFDNKNPSAEAEEAVFDFFLSTKAIPSVVIAGNHDSPQRLEALRQLLKLANVHVVGQPRIASQGGVFDLPIKGETARIAALPFVSERRIVKVTELLEMDVGQQLERYQENMRKLIKNLSSSFDPDVVNILMMHGTMDGATLSSSEYTFHNSETYALKADVLPIEANYVALGHIHKPQGIHGFSDHMGCYSGSIVQLDFGEAESKRVCIVDAQAGQPTTLREVPLKGGKRLKRVSVDYQDLERKHFDLLEFPGFLKLVVKLDQPRPGLKERIKQSLPNVLAVELELPESESELSVVDVAHMNLFEAYGQYYKHERAQDTPEHLQAAFKELLELQDEVSL